MWVLLLVLPVVIISADSNDFDEYLAVSRKLQLKLFTGYDSMMSPYNTKFTNFTWNSNGSYAHIFLLRSRLLSVQEPEQSFSTATGVIMQWTDPRLTWNPELFLGISHLYVRRSAVWSPQIIPCESTGVVPVQLFDTGNVKIYPNGQVATLAYFFATHNCEIKADNFPFDINHCTMCFMLAGNYEEEIQLRGAISPIADIFGTGEFDYEIYKPKPVVGVNYFDAYMAMSGVLFHFVITRQPQFWISLIILPTFFISMLVLIGIFFGEDSHSLSGIVEMGLAGMMSLTVIVGILNESTAKSKDLSALGRFVFYDIIIVVVAIIVTIASIKFRRKLLRLSNQKLVIDKSNVFWQNVKKYGVSCKISRYVLFLIFFTLHLANLITMLIRPADAGAFETVTTFNATYT